MVKIDLKNQCSLGVTSISNMFLDYYMPRANGEYVKIYLYLLRLTIDYKKNDMTIADISDMLECTSKDIYRALSYWENEGIVCCTFDTNGELTSLCFEDFKNNVIPKKDNLNKKIKEISPTKHKTINIPLEDKVKLLESDDIKEIVYVAERYLNKTLSSTEIDTIIYLYKDLGFNVDLIDYLIDYCVSKNKKSINYIKKTAFSWYDEGISDVNQAKTHTKTYSKEYIAILNALGINRALGAVEQEYINNWINNYKIDLDMIVEACNRTLKAIQKPSFQYVDTILKNWIDNNINDIKQLNKSPNKSYKKSPRNAFNTFNQRDYDFDELDELEESLLN